MAKSEKKAAAKKASDKRTLSAPNGDKWFIKRNEKGQIKESDDVSKSLSQDVKQHAQTSAKPSYGDKGDQPAKKVAPKKTAAKKK